MRKEKRETNSKMRSMKNLNLARILLCLIYLGIHLVNPPLSFGIIRAGQLREFQSVLLDRSLDSKARGMEVAGLNVEIQTFDKGLGKFPNFIGNSFCSVKLLPDLEASKRDFSHRLIYKEEKPDQGKGKKTSSGEIAIQEQKHTQGKTGESQTRTEVSHQESPLTWPEAFVLAAVVVCIGLLLRPKLNFSTPRVF